MWEIVVLSACSKVWWSHQSKMASINCELSVFLDVMLCPCAPSIASLVTRLATTNQHAPYAIQTKSQQHHNEESTTNLPLHPLQNGITTLQLLNTISSTGSTCGSIAQLGGDEGTGSEPEGEEGGCFGESSRYHGFGLGVREKVLLRLLLWEHFFR